MGEIHTSGSMSGEGKRNDATWPKSPRPSSTLLEFFTRPNDDGAPACWVSQALDPTYRAGEREQTEQVAPLITSHRNAL